MAAHVWAVRLGFLDDEGTRGTLELGGSMLTFSPEGGSTELSIPLSDIRRVRRAPGSPVLIVERSASAIAFYFVEPPPLRLRSEFSRKAKGRLRSISYLRGRNRTKREEVREWLERIRNAVAGAGP